MASLARGIPWRPLSNLMDTHEVFFQANEASQPLATDPTLIIFLLQVYVLVVTLQDPTARKHLVAYRALRLQPNTRGQH